MLFFNSNLCSRYSSCQAEIFPSQSFIFISGTPGINHSIQHITMPASICKRISFFIIIPILLGCSVYLNAQGKHTLSNSKSTMSLSGTSTMHDWTMNSKGFSSETLFQFDSGSGKELKGIQSLQFSLPAETLKSDKKGLDKNAYKALKTDQHKNIIFNMKSSKVSHVKGQTFQVSATGNLTVAGVTKPVTINVHCTVNADKSITCSGSHKLKMTDFDVKPPSFMLGAMKTGNDVVLDFSMNYIN